MEQKIDKLKMDKLHSDQIIRTTTTLSIKLNIISINNLENQYVVFNF